MRRIAFLLFLLTFSLAGMAQHELRADSIHHVTDTEEVKHFGSFLLDMKLMNMNAAKMPSMSLRAPLAGMGTAYKDYGKLFAPDKGSVFAQGFTDAFSYHPYTIYTAGWGYDTVWGMDANSDMLQQGSFKLKNGMKVNVYGKYGADGRLLPGMNVLPWQGHDFKGAFELRSASGSFGIKVEINRENPQW
jgi:hypothetical protein